MCTSPILIKLKEPDYYTGLHFIDIPCGKCCDCKMHYQKVWTVRMYNELQCHKFSTFFTLTYNEYSVPCTVDTNSGELLRTVCKSDVQLWLKRLRTNLDRYYQRMNKPTPKFKYFITSEYGTRFTKRPHYHGIIFGLCPVQIRSALNDWDSTHGFVNCSLIDCSRSGEVSNYVSKYCSKGVFENPLVSDGLVSPTFHLVSKHLGENYADIKRDYHLCFDCDQFRSLRSFIRVLYAFDKICERTNKSLANELSPSFLQMYDKHRKYILSQKYRIPRNYYDRVASRYFCILNDSFKYPFPKYYYDKIFTKNTFLHLQVKIALRKRIDQVRDEQLRQIQAEHPDWSDLQVVSYYDKLSLEKQELTEHRQFLKLKQFYNKSNF